MLPDVRGLGKRLRHLYPCAVLVVVESEKGSSHPVVLVAVTTSSCCSSTRFDLCSIH